MLNACLDAAATTGQVSVYLEPIALYHERDLHEVGDRGWLGTYSPARSHPSARRGCTATAPTSRSSRSATAFA